MNKVNLIAAFTAMLLAAPFAKSEAPANTVPTNLPGATTSIPPPAGFNPLTASDEDLATYGFPPRPNSQTDPDTYASWQRAMAASKVRIIPQLEMTNIFHGPVKSLNVQNTTVTSGNWSGSAAFGGATSYNSSTSFYYVISDYVVPMAQQAYGACTGGWDYESSWVGIDGYNSNDVLQAGTESDAYCNGSTKETFYSPWYEWYPAGEVRITNFPVVPGDDLFVEVWNTSATQGYAYFVNYNTNTSGSIGFTAPTGTTLIGNSAEWIVEEPGVGGGQATLTNYIWENFANCNAYTWAGTKLEAGSPTSVQITMVNSSGQHISYGQLQSATGIWIQDEGPAR